jgi:hypothetical protein
LESSSHQIKGHSYGHKENWRTETFNASQSANQGFRSTSGTQDASETVEAIKAKEVSGNGA